MKEYRITYISEEDGEIYEGCGRGFNGQEAVRRFLEWHFDCAKILSCRFLADHTMMA